MSKKKRVKANSTRNPSVATYGSERLLSTPVSIASKSLISGFSKIYPHIEWAPVAVTRQVIGTLSRIVGWKYLTIHGAAQVTALLIGNYANFLLMQRFSDVNTEVYEHYLNLSNPNINQCVLSELNLEDSFNNYNNCLSNQAEWYQFESVLFKALPIFAYYVTGQIITGYINQVFEKRLIRKASDEASKKLFSNQVSLAMSRDPESQTIIRNLEQDVRTVVNEGSQLITSAISVTQNGLLSIRDLYSFSNPIAVGPFKLPDLLTYSAIYGLSTLGITYGFSRKQQQLNDELLKESTKADAVVANDLNNIKSINQRDAEENVRKRHQSFRDSYRKISDRLALWRFAHDIWSRIHNITNNIFKFYIIGRKLFDQSIIHADREKVSLSDTNVQSLFSLSENQNTQMMDLRSPIKRVNGFYDEAVKYENEKKQLKLIKLDLMEYRQEERFLILRVQTEHL